MDNYLTNDIDNPKYLFHGSPNLFDLVEQRQSHDSMNNKSNIDYAVFLTSSFILASAYAFKDSLKVLSEGLEWNFNIGRNIDTNEIFINMDNINYDDELVGYIYVFNYEEEFEKDGIQYKCHRNIKPIDIVEIKFRDFKKYYSINSNNKKI